MLWGVADAWEERCQIHPRIGFLGEGTGLYPGMSAVVYLRFSGGPRSLGESGGRDWRLRDPNEVCRENVTRSHLAAN